MQGRGAQAASRGRRGRPPLRLDRRESILEAALACFVERGFHGTVIPEIATRAQVATGTLYHYFESKEALVNALYQKWKGAVSERVFAAFPQEATSREQFRVMWHEMVGFAREHPKAFAFIELHNHASYLDEQSRAVDRAVKDFAELIVANAQAQGVVKPLQAKLLMELAFGAFIAMIRADWEGRITLDDAAIAGAEAACWDALAL
jgi:TetR/AcrR family transcriptional regulator, repressor of fatR-cypB operon